MPQPLSDGFSFSDAFWLEYDAGMMRVLLIVLGLILAQAVVFYIASCFACCTFRRRQRPSPHDATSSRVTTQTAARGIHAASTAQSMRPAWNGYACAR